MRWSARATLLDRASSVFFNLAATDTNKDIQAIERALAPRFAKHGMRIYQDETLFARVDALFKKRKKLGLSEEQERVLERYHRAFVKSGAGLDAEGQEAHGGDRRAHVGARHQVQPEPAGRRAGVRDGAGGRA